MQSKRDYGIITFGLIEISMGLVTLVAVTTSLILGTSIKPLEVLVFVLVTAFISLGLGIGILRRNLHVYHLLLFFAAVIVLSKILIFTKIISLNGALETTITSSIKDSISIFYHSLLILYFAQPRIKKQFTDRRK